MSFLAKLAEIRKETAKNERDIAEIQAKREVLIAEMQHRYTFWYEVFGAIFQERKMVIDKQFEIIQKGIDEGKDEFVLDGLKSLADVVTSSPLGSAPEFAKLLASNQKIEL